ncbi:hypothetical protein M899_2567 [Bacteriovorax sp. BSW11_IV]|uniref:hypothetical protein n=1 Tax=Bacteriovorax sp. BSW11_IV TaxID=1353529 RepID=UPI000389F114|nr:hypothetical protein [Bacteriovorax sp. BSW11_IV]EQC50369.1 hypothetical protein M899_2567 [Bacteriovorax sp. BSW11_IV]
MKFLLLFILFIQTTFAQSDLVELKRRLELYGLLESEQFDTFSFELQKKIDVSEEKEIIKKQLHNDIEKIYIPKLEEVLGQCSDGKCLEVVNDVYKLHLPVKSVCLPYTSCGFYSCMEEKYQCDPEGVHYFTKLAKPTCEAYMKNIDQGKFSKKGMEWIYTVMVCLQKGLVDECEVRDNCHKKTKRSTCDYITDFTLKFHPGCYINSGPGVCKLPIKDKTNIWKTVGPFLTKRERIEAYKVVYHCIKTGF